MWFSVFVLAVALLISAISAFYSIIGLTTIFSAAALPVMIMGISLELGKITTVVWLHKYWKKADWKLKAYLVPAVILLMFITAMGTYGYLAKAHMDQTVPSGDVAAQVALLDEKIKTQRDNIQVQRENIAAARAALSQMDAQVAARLDRGTTEQSAERAVTIRRQQKNERAALNKEITAAQAEIEQINLAIAKLNEERAPVASKLRKVEAEVGPIKYIAALIYGDNPDQNILERAVRWVIILLVTVFDPLALCLVIASISSRKWEDEVIEDDDHAKLERVMEARGKASVLPIAGDTNVPPLSAKEIEKLDELISTQQEETNLKKRLTDWNRSPVLNLLKKISKSRA